MRRRILHCYRAALTAAAIGGALAAAPAAGQHVYTRTDRNGTLVFSDAPTDVGYEAHKITGHVPPASAAPPAGATDGEALYTKAKTLLDTYRGEARRLEEAKGYLLQIGPGDPSYALAQVGLARVAFKAGYQSREQFDPQSLHAAQQYVDRALQIDPNLFEAHQERGYLCVFQSRFDCAQQAAKIADKIRPDTAQVALLRAWIGKRTDDSNEVFRQTDIVLQKTAERGVLAEAHQLRAVLYRDGNEHEKADAEYRQVLELEPSPWAKVNYAQFLIQRREHDRAIELTQEAMRTQDFGVARKTLVRAYVGKADSLVQTQPKEAIRWAEQALEVDQFNESAFEAMGNAYEQLAKVENDPAWSKKAMKARGQAASAGLHRDQVMKQTADGRPLDEQVQALLKDLTSAEWRTRLHAADELGKIIPPARQALPALIAVARTDGEEHVRSAALVTAAHIDPENPDVVQLLTDSLHDKAPLVVHNATALTAKAGTASVPGLVTALGDPNPTVRNEAAIALSELGTEAKDAIPALIQALADRDDYVRRNSARALGANGAAAAAAVPALMKCLDDKKGPVRAEAISALQKIATPEAQAALARYQQSQQASR